MKELMFHMFWRRRSNPVRIPFGNSKPFTIPGRGEVIDIIWMSVSPQARDRFGVTFE